jgi:predicted DNA-binding transcriptional regulator YafY
MLSSGAYLSTPEMVVQFGATKKIIQTDLKEYILPLFDDGMVYYDYVDKRYKAKAPFLQHTLLSAKELAIIAVLKNKSKDKYSDLDFASMVDALFAKFEEELANRLYQKSSVEKIDDFTKETILIKNAIANKCVIQCEYNGKKREIYPLSILNLEGYWYLVIFNPNEQKIKSFHLNSIKEIKILDQRYSFDSDIIIKYDNAISAYYNPKAKPITIQLFVDAQIAKYFLRKPLNPTQRVLRSYEDSSIEIELEVTDLMEVIPVIQRYIPHVVVIEPRELHEKILENIKAYKQKLGVYTIGN